jgi:tripartite-type tricarboxylate transporter receptor subunit TctC
MARLIGQRLTSILGQSIVIDNRPGAGGTIGARAVAESDPDGYTLLLGNTSTLVISPLIYKNVNYDPVKGFAPIAALGTTSNLLIVNPALPVKSVQELIALARAKPGKLNYASAGIGTPPHLIGEMFKQRLGLDVVHVPIKAEAHPSRPPWRAKRSSRLKIPHHRCRWSRPGRSGHWPRPATGAARRCRMCRR